MVSQPLKLIAAAARLPPRHEKHRVERSDTPQADSWTTLLDNIAGTGGTLQVTDVGAAAQSKRFYRIVIP